jgi:hypothetical protein
MNVAKNNKAHFHTDYTYAVRPAVYKDLFIPSIVSMHKKAIECGVKTKIYNCNKFSELKCFDFKDIKDLL